MAATDVLFLKKPYLQGQDARNWSENRQIQYSIGFLPSETDRKSLKMPSLPFVFLDSDCLSPAYKAWVAWTQQTTPEKEPGF